MTRTERAHHPRAIVRDRSVSKTGLSSGVRKHGAGQHNWGDAEHELEWEELAVQDGKREVEEEEEEKEKRVEDGAFFFSFLPTLS